MKTKIITLDTDLAAELIRSDELVAVPTETVYGLAGNGLSSSAVEKIYEVKGRPPVKPLALMVPSWEAMEVYCEDVPEAARLLAKKYWPGPLSIVLKSKNFVPEIVRAGGDTVALRCPDHELTLSLLRKAGLPLAAPSANPSGSQSPKNAQTVLNYFDGKISAVIDGGDCTIGTESTIVDLSRRPYRILREAALSAEEIIKALTAGLKIVGITGGTGVGKTTVLRELSSLGALIIDCDEVYHGLLNNSEALNRELCKNFPEAFESGVLQRKKLGAVVFADEDRLKTLNSISHRYICLEVERLLGEWAVNGGRLAAIDAVELINSPLAGLCCKTVAVLAPTEERIKRILERDGISREYAELRVKAQKSDEYYAENCDTVLRNDGDKAEFTEKCRKLFKEVL